MRKTILCIFFIAFLLIVTDISNATINIVYPKKNGATINAKSTFLVGSVSKGEKLFINSKEVKTSVSGAFAQYVKLDKDGENSFVIKTENDELKFIINKSSNINCPNIKEEFVNLPTAMYKVTKETPLRSTPVDGGINRLATLPKDTKLIIDGKLGAFARVYLSKEVSAWILTKDVQLENCENISYNFAKIKKFKKKKNNEYLIYEIKFTEKVPFTINETDKELVFNFYNIKKLKDKFQIKYSSNKLLGYDYEYNHDKFILKIRQKTVPTVVIDAGHGGNEHGAIGCGGVAEKSVNLNIAKFLEEELKSRQVKTYMTRKSDEKLSLNYRCDIARKREAQILVSIHSNAIPDGENPMLNRGTSVYYYHPQAKHLAENILTEVTKQAKTNNDKVRQRSLALVRPTHSISILIEVGYMINPYDYDMLIDEDFQKLCAQAIADGIVKYLNE